MTTTARARRRHAAALLALPLVLAACGTQHAGSGSAASTGGLPLLHVGTRAAMDGAPDIAGAGSGTGSGADSGYLLDGTLPTGPASAPVYRTAADAGAVSALASALQLPGDPVRHAHGWSVDRGGSELRVRDDGTWSYWRSDATCPSRVDVDSADPSTTAVGCAPPNSVAKSAPSDADALAAARPVLSASGAEGAATVSRSDAVRVSAARAVDGLDVAGGDTSVTVDTAGVVDASGSVGAPAAGPAYPLISAAQALDLLRAMPKPAIACAVGATCPGVGPQHVTGARLGLVPAQDGPDSVLLPAWLFTVKDQTAPIAVMAVQDAYLADPVGSGGSGSGGSSASAVPGSSGGGSAGSNEVSMAPAPPAATATDQPLPTATPAGPLDHPVAISRAAVSADGRTLTLFAEGGSCQDYAAEAKEDPSTVYAVLTATPAKKGIACPAVITEVSASVRLDAPLGSRSVVDSGLNSMPAVPVAR